MKPLLMPPEVAADIAIAEYQRERGQGGPRSFIPADHLPHPKQAEFLALDCREALYGGAAGGGKTNALLAGALRYAHIPGYAALLLRRTFPMFTQPDGLIPRSHEWLNGTGALWSTETKTWTFPSGAVLRFGHMEHEDAKYNYQGGGYHFVGFDELSQFTESQYLYLFSRTRRREGFPVPVQVRSASNPGGPGHQWVKERFGLSGTAMHAAHAIHDPQTDEDRWFIPARLADNPSIDRADYERSLWFLAPTEREQYLSGNWDATFGGTQLRREWFKLLPAAPKGFPRVRYWDLAATEALPGTDPDYSAGGFVTRAGDDYIVHDIAYTRSAPPGVQALTQQTAARDGRATPIVIELEPGAEAIHFFHYYATDVLSGYQVQADRVARGKDLRAVPLANLAAAGQVYLVDGPWVDLFLQQAVTFPGKGHDDLVDVVAGAINYLSRLENADAGGGAPAVARRRTAGY